MRDGILSIAAILLLLFGASGEAAPSGLFTHSRVVEGKPIPASLAKPSVLDLERQVFIRLNDRRREKGMSQLIWNEKAARIARLHSKNMADRKFFSHRGLDGLMVNDRAKNVGLTNWRSIGENIAYLQRGYQYPADIVFERWMQSSRHRKNMLDKNWKESAVGLAISSDGTYYFTQVFLKK